MLSFCLLLRKNISKAGRLGMPSACALGIFSGKTIYIRQSGKSADFPDWPFHGRVATENSIYNEHYRLSEMQK